MDAKKNDKANNNTKKTERVEFGNETDKNSPDNCK